MTNLGVPFESGLLAQEASIDLGQAAVLALGEGECRRTVVVAHGDHVLRWSAPEGDARPRILQWARGRLACLTRQTPDQRGAFGEMV